MFWLEILLAGSMLVALTFYALSAGADYGGGVWDFLARGKRAESQRDLIASAIAPIWEANHVWLILVVVILFTAFPYAYSLLSVSLHIPLTLVLIGIVLRGSAFAFRSYDSSSRKRRWGRIFSISSTITPILLGTIIGTLASGRIETASDNFYRTFVAPWLSAFPLSVGLFALALFAFLAAVYLTLESPDQELQDIFRRRALIACAAVAALAITVLALSSHGAPFLQHKFSQEVWAPVVMAGAVLNFGITIFALWKRRYRLARLTAAALVTIILWGWAFAQYPYLIVPHVLIFDAGAPEATMRLVLIALIAGSVLLFPSFFFLYKSFKRY